MIMIVMALLVFVSIFIVGYPLMNAQRYELETEAQGNDRLEYLASVRNAVFDAIRDLEFDRATGKLSDEDYRQMRAQYDAQAVQVLQQLDALTATQKEAPPKQSSAAKTTCPRCHKRVQAGDRFCPSCGASLV